MIREVEPGMFVDGVTGEILKSSFVRPPRPARCGTALGGSDVTVHADGNHSHFSGTERCSSIWACPVCSAVIRRKRAEEISQVVDGHQQVGGHVLFVTLTLKHKRSDDLGMLLDGLLKSWSKLLTGGQWTGNQSNPGMKKQYGIVGYIRSTEVTWSQNNGWHPHIHALFLVQDDLSPAAIEAFGNQLHARWARFATAATGRVPSRKHGIDVQKLDGEGKVLAQYLGKLQEKPEPASWPASAELARTDLKVGRKDSLVPFQFLDPENPLPEGQRRALWNTYYKATKSRRAITWSKDLKHRYLVAEKTDEELLAETETAQAVYVIQRKAYETLRVQAPDVLALILDMAVKRQWSVIEGLVPGYRLPASYEQEIAA